MRKIKVGLVGYGYIGKVHSVGYSNIPIVIDNLDIEIEMSKVIRRKESIKEKNLWLSLGHEIEDLVNEGVEIADICTPNYLHRSQVEYLAKNGVNIYCEKPLGLNYEECTRLADITEEEDIINQVALVYRFMPAIAKARSFLLNNGLGDIINFRGHLFHGSYLNPKRPISWRLQRNKSGGGALVDLGIHIVDTVRFLLGEVESVKAETNTVFKERPNDDGGYSIVDVDDWGLVNLDMVDGAKGTIEVSKVSVNPLEVFNIEIYGTKGFIKITDKDFYEPNVFLFNKDNNLEKITIADFDPYSRYLNTIIPSPKMSLGSMIDMHLASQVNILNNISKNRIIFHETPTFSEGAKSQKIIDLAYQSEYKGGKQSNI
ncbi:Gfo/Idh/MocA family protein [Sporosalibacterium faouarense]|uniref:Gfo/Idh/MocA family protein n=1 Tax=Sporosalibacterium faouarense TaxID=516123 RepID=UPI00192AAB66|nr:Gfo/Idh/MocA family oxidoreductase [Sporosalibacterium faouarense]